MPARANEDPWTLYWQADRLDSCIAAADPSDAAEIITFWRRFARKLPSAARVLDLATGNGAVPHQLLDANDALAVTAVDKSDIDPPRYVSGSPYLRRVAFMGGIDVCDLPFEDDSFDAVTSQFGIEYAPLDAACRSLARVLEPGGAAGFVMHHVDSEIVMPAQPLLRELEALLDQNGVMAVLQRYARGEEGLDALGSARARYLASDCRKTRRVSGQILEGLERVVRGMNEGAVAESRRMAAGMSQRLGAERTRLRQLTSAALDRDDTEKLCEWLSAAGLDVRAPEPLIVGHDSSNPALVGWTVLGRKRARQ